MGIWSIMTENNETKSGCTFCPLPWNSINLRNNGDLRICCNTNSYSPQRGIMRKEDGTPYNAGRDDWNEARNAEILKEVRASMLKDEWHPECERCRQEEINGIRSRREYESDDWAKWFGNHIDIDKAKEVTQEDGTLDVEKQDINFVDIRYGNFCNLKCRMCGPTDSHKWYEDHVKLTGRTHYKDTHEKIQLTKNNKGKYHTDQYDWFQNNNMYWNNFEKYAANAKKLYIVGGEPLIIDEHFESLERIVANGTAKDMRLEYNTNLTNVPPRLIKMWEKFKEVRIGVSIDGTGDVFNYQRTPANFDAVYQNMLKIDQNPDINLKGWFAFTVTPMNVFHFVEFMKWKLISSGLTRFNPVSDSRPIVSHHMCHSPKYYNVKVLPQYLKDQVAEHYQEHIDWVNTTDFSDKVKRDFAKVANGVLKFMMSEDYSTGMCWNDNTWLQEFVEVTTKLDEIRNQNILDIVPQYKALFDAHNE
jgi:sulfatase maturation enzyme AslB (radical SAM superfamily)